MQHTNRFLIATAAVAGLVSLAAVSYAAGSERGPARNGDPTPATATGVESTEVLDDSTREALIHMVEEEKLAHDVYVTLGESTGLTIFDRISTSETRHESAVRTLLDRHGIPDPTTGRDVGEFTDPAFTALYDQLVAKGASSESAALEVGTTIEALDIDDLEARIEVMPSDVAQVFERLLAGSERHLAAFDRALG